MKQTINYTLYRSPANYYNFNLKIAIKSVFVHKVEHVFLKYIWTQPFTHAQTNIYVLQSSILHYYFFLYMSFIFTGDIHNNKFTLFFPDIFIKIWWPLSYHALHSIAFTFFYKFSLRSSWLSTVQDGGDPLLGLSQRR